jgi:hypothetical protein
LKVFKDLSRLTPDAVDLITAANVDVGKWISIGEHRLVLSGRLPIGELTTQFGDQFQISSCLSGTQKACFQVTPLECLHTRFAALSVHLAGPGERCNASLGPVGFFGGFQKLGGLRVLEGARNDGLMAVHAMPANRTSGQSESTGDVSHRPAVDDFDIYLFTLRRRADTTELRQSRLLSRLDELGILGNRGLFGVPPLKLPPPDDDVYDG